MPTPKFTRGRLNISAEQERPPRIDSVAAEEDLAPSDAEQTRGRRNSRLVRGLTGRLFSIASSVLVVLVLFVIWQILSDTKTIDPFFVSSPTRVGSLLWQWRDQASFWHDVVVTLSEALWGYLIGCVAGVIIGLALGQSRILANTFMPLLNMANTLPRVALAPLFILWFGIGEESKVILVISVVITIVIFNTYAGVQTIEEDLVTNVRLLGASSFQVLTKIVFPWTLPWILSGFRIALAWSIGAAVIGEYIAAEAGLGYRIFYYSGVLNETGLLAGCAALLILSGILFAILGAIEHYLLRWRPNRK
jgi:NitT/TauT family transport system permease protein